MPSKDQCPFCKLIANPEQLLIVGETDNFYAWLEINPRAKGHTMIVPKEHKESLMDFSPSEYDEAMKLTRRVIEKAEEGLDADGASVTINIGEAGGQMVPHAYIQVFPRFQEEENAGTPTGAIFPQREEIQQKLDEIKKSMSSVTVNFEENTKEAHPESKKFLEKSEVSKAAKKTSKTKKQEEEKEEDEETQEKEEKEESETSNESREEEENLEGEGHWDGKSFEWR